MKQLAFRATPEFSERLHSRALAEGISLQSLIVKAVDRFLSLPDLEAAAFMKGLSESEK